MLVEDFNYNLPEELIAQVPLKNRSESKLLVVDKKTGELSHHHFYEIVDMLNENDVLVLNDTKVLPSRIYGIKQETNAHIEMLLLKDLGENLYEVLAKPARRLKVGTIVNFGDLFKAEVIETFTEGIVHVRFIYEGIFLELLEKYNISIKGILQINKIISRIASNTILTVSLFPEQARAS